MSAKKLDEHNRWRSKTVAFRMSPEEADMLDKFVKLSGLTKQDYLIDRVLQRDVKVQGNPRVFKALRNELTSLSNELKRIIEAGQVSDEFLNVTNMALTILSCMNEAS
jgi:uncharacterized protein (DUF1778 family)